MCDPDQTNCIVQSNLCYTHVQKVPWLMLRVNSSVLDKVPVHCS